MNELYVACDICGATIDTDNINCFDDRVMCNDCFAERTLECDHCGRRIWADDAVCDAETSLCQSCFDSHYTRCYECGAILGEGSACYYSGEDYCASCYDDICASDAIHSYDYKPSPIFYPPYQSENVYLGVELEIDEGGEDRYSAEKLLNIANAERENMYIKHDGSLDDGMELVSHPMTLAEHEVNLPWRDICRKAISLGYTSHQARTCGLHVHVSRACFGDYEQQEAVIGRILYFMEAHWNEMLKFSSRTQGQLDRWASRYGYKNSPKEILEHAKKSDIGRYACVNLKNSNTIEFRIFRGTLKYSSFIAALQFTDCICKAAIAMSDEDFKAMSWSGFVSNITHTELVEYLKSRRLYVNDIIETEGEI